MPAEQVSAAGAARPAAMLQAQVPLQTPMQADAVDYAVALVSYVGIMGCPQLRFIHLAGPTPQAELRT